MQRKWNQHVMVPFVAALLCVVAGCGSNSTTASSTSNPSSSQKSQSSSSYSSPTSKGSPKSGTPQSSSCDKPYVINTVAYPAPSGSITPLWVTKEGGYFKKHCLEVKKLSFIHGPRIAQALLSGHLQFGVIGDPEVMRADTHGGRLVVLGITNQKPFMWIEAPKNVTSLKQLKGDDVGITAIGSLTDYTMKEAVKSVGLTYKDFHVQSMGGQKGLAAALVSGTIKAAPIVPPFTIKLEASGFHPIFSPQDIPSSQVVTGPNIVTTKKFLSQHRDVAVRFMQAYVEGLHRARTDKALAVKAILKYTKSNKKTASQVYAIFLKGIFAKVPPVKHLSSFQAELEMLKSHYPKLKGANLKSMMDMSVLQDAMKANQQ